MNIIKKIFFFWKNKNFFNILSDDNKSGAATYYFKNVNFLIKKNFFNIYFLQNCYRQFDSYVKKKNKLSIHKQIQIICFPVPINFLILYKESLFFIKNFFFKKDNWKSPLLGAKGIGFEVLINNIEISQITLFNYFGNKKLFFPILEITYGIERLSKIINNFLIKEKFFSINNIYNKFKLKKIFFLYKMCLINIYKKNFFFSYYIFIKITNQFNIIDELYLINNYNRIKIIIFLKKLSEKIFLKL